MRNPLRLLILLAAMFALAACDQSGRPIEQAGLEKLARGVSAESDVRMVFGAPHTVWDDPDGTRTLVYPKGPQGARTWMFRIGADGKLTNYWQALTEQNFARIQAGMGMEEVRRLLGPPGNTTRFERKNEEVWDWRYLDGVQERFFHVHFDLNSGRVVTTSTSEPRI
jgi:outer membrane protein assembly factor BamE (lipoprotein component of BamABCDE complex)